MNKFLPAIFFLLSVSIIGRMYFIAEKKINMEIDENLKKANIDLSKKEIPVITQEEMENWESFINNRVGCHFKYPIDNLTKAITEVVKFPSIIEGQSRTLDDLEFAVGESLFKIKTYVKEEETGSIVNWIKQSDKSYSSDLGDYEVVKIASTIALRVTGKTFLYALANKNIYEIAAYRNGSIINIGDEPLFEKWISTFDFFEQVECWKDGPGDPFKKEENQL